MQMKCIIELSIILLNKKCNKFKVEAYVLIISLN